MDLLDENNNKKNKKTTGQKLVLAALIISIILFNIAYIIAMLNIPHNIASGLNMINNIIFNI